MSAPLCTVTPLEALRRLCDVARKVDAKESGEFETLLQGELAVAEAALRAAAPVVPVAAQPVGAVPEDWPTEAMIQAGCLSQQTDPKYDNYEDWWNSHSGGVSERIRDMLTTEFKAMIAAAPQPAASVTDVAKDAARYDWLRSTGKEQLNVMAHYAGEEMDKAIDAAIAAQQGEKTK